MSKKTVKRIIIIVFFAIYDISFCFSQNGSTFDLKQKLFEDGYCSIYTNYYIAPRDFATFRYIEMNIITVKSQDSIQIHSIGYKRGDEPYRISHDTVFYLNEKQLASLSKICFNLQNKELRGDRGGSVHEYLKIVIDFKEEQYKIGYKSDFFSILQMLINNE